MLEENTKYFKFIENLTGTANVDNLVHVNIQYVSAKRVIPTSRVNNNDPDIIFSSHHQDASFIFFIMHFIFQ